MILYSILTFGCLLAGVLGTELIDIARTPSPQDASLTKVHFAVAVFGSFLLFGSYIITAIIWKRIGRSLSKSE